MFSSLQNEILGQSVSTFLLQPPSFGITVSAFHFCGFSCVGFFFVCLFDRVPIWWFILQLPVTVGLGPGWSSELKIHSVCVAHVGEGVSCLSYDCCISVTRFVESWNWKQSWDFSMRRSLGCVVEYLPHVVFCVWFFSLDTWLSGCFPVILCTSNSFPLFVTWIFHFVHLSVDEQIFTLFPFLDYYESSYEHFCANFCRNISLGGTYK